MRREAAKVKQDPDGKSRYFLVYGDKTIGSRGQLGCGMHGIEGITWPPVAKLQRDDKQRILEAFIDGVTCLSCLKVIVLRFRIHFKTTRGHHYTAQYVVQRP
jgi:hypothetical protein